ncbi:hypothetical protein BRC19_02360 [Candidatus Saccharibacteria bacterium QS_5_54_17]|nr:MAG: hypothetical protein BRC19_02360 [Candidatus Saccharibacteria bacterium QS_5_54_17]
MKLSLKQILKQVQDDIFSLSLLRSAYFLLLAAYFLFPLPGNYTYLRIILTNDATRRLNI